MNQIDSFVRNLGDQLGRFIGNSAAREDMRRSLNIAAQRAFDSLDLVTREQFDEQVEKLRQAEARLTELENELTTLQAMIKAPVASSED